MYKSVFRPSMLKKSLFVNKIRGLTSVTQNISLKGIFSLILVVLMLNISTQVNAQHNELSLSEFTRIIPKAETHIHFSALIYPDLALKLAKKNNVELSYSTPSELITDKTWTVSPFNAPSDELWGGYFQRLAEFQSVIKTSDDVKEVVVEWARRSGIVSNVKYAEIHIPYPNASTALDIDLDSYFEGFKLAREQIKEDYGIDLRYVGETYILSHDVINAAKKEVETYGKYKEETAIVGISILSIFPDITDVKPVLDLARSLGFKAPMHLGNRAFSPDKKELVKPMWDAIDILHIDRIDHGYFASFDLELVDHIADKKIPMTNCPHVIVGKFVFPKGDIAPTFTWDNFPFKLFYEHDVVASLHTDTPAMGSSYTLAEVYEEVVDQYDYDKEDVIVWAENSFRSALISDSEMKKYLKELKDWVYKNN
ncbi:adenosine deaminase family protein [Flammeovirga kamogawensis]|uniref:Adenosine deaminase domain-containing protein n=1 Tax=Flammeovirga kamogawensis TaxID=373891 RepID=A0ABX8H2E9_9BACT|nr:hypothetical protein [Flammeovirga kamogawensis]MBB6460193.1 adenosine deaminase [Flammeovirga kamogawensis]QWG10005.1 hypothetical protein KM029_20195 [Flammeovirga kamogawensis]TRX65513.1 hypothetical protein EO216_23625 [Flammeovirga kamogawensis]